MSTVTVLAVPRSRRTTPPRSAQMDDPTWERLGGAAKHLGMSRSALLAALAMWFGRQPGAKLPPRPTDEQIAAGMAALAAEEAEREAKRAATAEQAEKSA